MDGVNDDNNNDKGNNFGNKTGDSALLLPRSAKFLMMMIMVMIWTVLMMTTMIMDDYEQENTCGDDTGERAPRFDKLVKLRSEAKGDLSSIL